MTAFLLLRHGETLWNRAGRLQGWQDSALSARGLAQADALAVRLAGERVDVLVSSDLGRARATAASIAARLELPLALEPGLRERCYGALEGMTWGEVERAYPEAYGRLAARDPDYLIPGGQSAAEFRDRVVGTLERLALAYGEAVVAAVTHGGVLGIVYRHANGIPLARPRTFGVPNAGLNRVRIEGQRWAVDGWGEVDHLPRAAHDHDWVAGRLTTSRRPDDT